MKSIMTFALLVCSTVNFAQKYVHVGEQVPDIVFHHVANYKSSSASLKEFRGKLVILDFWGSTCSSCIHAFPEMYALQKQFKEQLQIILVNPGESEAEAHAHLREYMTRNTLPDIPIAYGDSDLREIFHYISYPHHIWIDSTGKMIAATYSYNATAKHISDLLAGKPVFMALKDEITGSTEKDLIPDTKVKNNAIWFSGFSHYDPQKLGGSLHWQDTVTSTTKVIYTNIDLVNLLKQAFFPYQPWTANVINNSHNIEMIEPTDGNQLDEWYKNNLFCYEMILPESIKTMEKEIFRMDVNRLGCLKYGIKAQLVKRFVPCYIVTSTADSTIHTKNNSGANRFINDGTTLSWQATPMGTVLRYYKGYFEEKKNPVYFFIEATKDQLNNLVDMSVPADSLDDISVLNSRLQQYGFKVTLEDRLIDVLLIEDCALE